ncbi:MAG: hypothetical protein J0H67_12820 [Rhodospirillales bacterium]|nr:hypothetical protein [Rhodospirillales bacterium]
MRRPRPVSRRLKPDLPEVPTTSAAPPTPPPEPAPDPAAEEAEAAIRKMVEAAYT